MRYAADGPGTGSGQGPVVQTGRPPVPGRAPEAAQHSAPAGEQRTDQAPSSSPSAPPSAGAPAVSGGSAAEAAEAPWPENGPLTGRLQVGGYPPQVPGPARGRAGTADAAATERPRTPGGHPQLGRDGNTGGVDGG